MIDLGRDQDNSLKYDTCRACAHHSTVLIQKNKVPFSMTNGSLLKRNSSTSAFPQALQLQTTIIIIIIIIIYHDFPPPPRRGSHVKSDKHTLTIINIHPLAHILDICALIFSSCALFTVYPNRIM